MRSSSTYWTAFLFVGATIILISGQGCQPKLEQTGIPIWGGMALEANCSSNTYLDNFQEIEAWNFSGAWIEIEQVVRQHPESQVPYYEKSILDTLVATLEKKQLPYGLVFNLNNLENWPMTSLRLNPLLSDWSTQLLRTNGYPPRYVGFSGAWLDTSLQQQVLPGLITQLKAALPVSSPQVFLAGTPTQWLEGDIRTDLADILGINFMVPPTNELKTYFINTNGALAKLATQYEKPVFLTQSNLLGDQQLLLFKNQLRFWPDSALPIGLVINTLYCELPVVDRTSPFALGKNTTFLSYLRSYVK
ncbi:MAG: hypothetical protein AAGI38_05805 [Bacteroidota bacterium]